MTLEATEFLRRFLMHVLPPRFVKIRYFGFLANRRRTQNIVLARTLLGVAAHARIEERIKPLLLCPDCYAAQKARSHRGPFDPVVRPPPREFSTA